MKRFLIAVIGALSLAGCGELFDSCPDAVECNGGCMPVGADCCNSSGYCKPGYFCNTAGTCSSGGGGGGSYYVSANGCAGGATVSYQGSDSSTCNYKYNYAQALSCTKILWDCN